MRFLVVLMMCVAVSGCGPYKPNLATPPKDQAKYEGDRNFCISQGRQRKKDAELFAPDSLRTPREMADDCMAAKGYNVVKR